MTYQNAGLGMVALLSLVIYAWAIVCVLRRPAWAFRAASKSKGLWVVMILVGIVMCNVGVFVSIWYLFVVDPRVRAMQQVGPGIGFPGRTSDFPR
jgi:hypothetical protein